MKTLLNQQTFSKKRTVPGRHNRSTRRSEHWAVILAGGDGTRLQSMTRTITGDDRPKQFVSVIGGATLLDQTRRRVELSVDPNRTLFVVTEKHRRFYESLGQGSLVEQPSNKGTAPAIVYALMRIAARSPKAIVAFFPSDHYFADDEEFMSHVDSAFESVRQSESITLLGITPTSPETEYGWIEPAPSILSSAARSVTRVNRFWEKPNADIASSLMRRGCLWNTFVMVGRVETFLNLTREAMPELFAQFARSMPVMGTKFESGAIHDLYAKLQEANFSHQVLAQCPGDLAVMRVSDVGWSDLGEPARVLATLAQMGVQTEQAMSAS